MRTAAVATTVTGLSLVCIALWLRPLVAAERALARGEIERAAQQYSVGRSRLDRLPFAEDLFPGLGDLATRNELALQYTLRRYDRILEDAGNDTSRRASASFWAGCALFDKAIGELEPKARMDLMSEAHRSFRRGLESAPEDWDTKFNFEVTARWLHLLKQQPESVPQEIIKLLRQRGPQPGNVRRTG